MKRIITGTIISIAFSILTYLALVNFEGYLLYDVFEVQPSGKLKLDNWINEFYETALVTIVISFGGVLIWYLFGFINYRITNWRNAKGFLAWLFIFVGTIVIASVYGYKFTPPTEERGKGYALFSYFVNVALIYWLSTAIFSPSTVKYVPLGSMRLRLASLGNFLVKRLG